MKTKALLILIILALAVATYQLSRRPHLTKDGLFLLPNNDQDVYFVKWAQEGGLSKGIYEKALRVEIKDYLPNWDTFSANFKLTAGFLGKGDGSLDEQIRLESGGRLTINKYVPNTGPNRTNLDPDQVDVSYVRIREIEFCVYGATLYIVGTKSEEDPNILDEWSFKKSVGVKPNEVEIETNFRIQIIKQIQD